MAIIGPGLLLSNELLSTPVVDSIERRDIRGRRHKQLSNVCWQRHRLPVRIYWLKSVSLIGPSTSVAHRY
jgi:hypothetical protein